MSLFSFILEISNPALDFAFNLITSSYLLIPLIVCLILIVKNKSKAKAKKFNVILIILPVVLAVIFTGLITTGIKEVIYEDRPCKTIQYFHFCEESNSFPSRHTAIAFASLPFLVYLRKYFIIMLMYASMVGIGMIYLGLHYPHDVLFGFVIGFIIGYLCFIKKEWINEKFIKIMKI